MAHFGYTTTTPTLPSYLFQADLVVSIIPPQTFTAVPTRDGRAYLHWDKDYKTSNDAADLYTEIYRSRDLDTWTLAATLSWAGFTDYTDSGVSPDLIYYYRLRFVRKDANSVVTNTSNYTIALAVRMVTLLGFEPRDTYSNKFFKYLVDSMPGTRIYDHTPAAHFSSNTYHLWQTTCKIVDGFNLYVNGSLSHEEPADATALSAKRPVSFILDKKQSQLTSTELSTGTAGDLVQVNAYLIYTFLRGYAIQLLGLYEDHLQIVANKFIDYSQAYTKGFRPVVSSEKAVSVADLYYSFGKLLNLEALRSQNIAQGTVRYKNMLKSSFSNIDDVGKVSAVHHACSDVLGITNPTLLEYYRQHWWKSDREHKLYVVPSGVDNYEMYVMPSGVLDNKLQYILDDPRFWSVIQYSVGPSGIGLTGAGEGWLEVLGSTSASPYSYLFNVFVSDGVTTALDVINLFTADPYASSIITATPSGGAGADVIDTDGAGIPGQLLRVHSPWLGWEDTLVKLYGRNFMLKDVVNATESGTDLCTMSRMLSKADPTTAFAPRGHNTWATPPTEETEFNKLDDNGIAIVRDDGDEGVGFFRGTTAVSLTGEKRMLFRIGHTVSNMTWLTRASLKIFVDYSSKAGYLRLYRIRKKYDSSDVCWNFTDKEASGVNAWQWDNTNEVFSDSLGGQDWVSWPWETRGAKGDSDAVFLKEFYIEEITSPSWVTLDITDILRNIYKYEAAHLNMGDDPENVIDTGFMLTLNGYDNQSLFIARGHTDSEFKPRIVWERLSHGFYRSPADNTRYFYLDGTTRYGRLLVMDSDREPISYVKTVHERIRQEDIRLTSDMQVALSATPPTSYVAGVRIYCESTGAVGTISSVSNNTLYVSMEVKTFAAGDTLRLLSDPVSSTALVSGVSYTGNKYVKLSRVPVSTSLIRVHHTGSGTSPMTPPADYPEYGTWTEGGNGVSPIFVSSVSGVLNTFATQDEDERDVLYLNSNDALASIGDVIVTYQYDYQFIMLGRITADSDSISNIEGCNRLGSGLYAQRENDYLYNAELMLPQASTGEFVDISGDSLVDEYSDHNLKVLSSAVSNIKRYNSMFDIFKYNPVDKPYRFGQQYHQFLKRI